MALLPLLLALGAAPVPPPCQLIFPVVPDEAAARRIAESVIAVRGSPRDRRYVLKVMPDRDDAGQWLAFQSLPEPRQPRNPRRIVVSTGGGGLGMRIDRCTGTISRLSYQR